MKIPLLYFFILIFSLPLLAQNREQTFKIVYKKVPPVIAALNNASNDPKYNKFKKEFKAMQRRMENLRYNLWINRTESVFQQQEQLQNDGRSQGGIEEISGGGNGIYYFNKETKELFHKKHFPGKGRFYRIVIDYPKYAWTVQKETKIIAGYTCYRATAEVVIEDAVVIQVGDSPTTKTATETIEAWFAPSLPSLFGPTEYVGLPGLVLMAGERIKFEAISVEMINNTEVPIKKPTEGELITEEEYAKKIVETMRKIRGY